MTALVSAPNYPLPKAGLSFVMQGSKPRPVLFVGDTPFLYCDISVDTAPTNMFFASYAQDPSGGVGFVPVGAFSLSNRWVMSDDAGNVFRAIGIIPLLGPWLQFTCGGNSTSISIQPLYSYLSPPAMISPSYTDRAAVVLAAGGVDTTYIPISMAGEFELTIISTQPIINANVEQYDPVIGWVIRNRIQTPTALGQLRVFLTTNPTRIVMQNGAGVAASLSYSFAPRIP